MLWRSKAHSASLLSDLWSLTPPLPVLAPEDGALLSDSAGGAGGTDFVVGGAGGIVVGAAGDDVMPFGKGGLFDLFSCL